MAQVSGNLFTVNFWFYNRSTDTERLKDFNTYIIIKCKNHMNLRVVMGIYG